MSIELRNEQYVIFDIDGTLNCGPSPKAMSFIESHPKDWNSFFEEMRNSPVNPQMIALYNMCLEVGLDVVIMTARGETYWQLTVETLESYGINLKDVALFTMRPRGDFRRSVDCKVDMLDVVVEQHMDGKRPVLITEDRQDVVDAFQQKGYNVMKVYPEHVDRTDD